MRLLHSTHLKLVEFMERDLPPYAILSHTWEMEEVSFQEMQSDDAKSRKGYSKIEGCCKVAAAWGFEYVWVDTCCIDKTSSAELSEAINSMFAWYQKADVCYVYLSDYPFPAQKDNSLMEQSFKNSRWFTRGWTLQELIAQESVVFFNSNWQDIGTKYSLGSLIFAWATSFPATRHYTGGLLADCPSTFANTKFIVPDSDKNTLPFETTNKGIHL